MDNNTLELKISYIEEDVKEIKNDLRAFIAEARKSYVTKDELNKRLSPLEKILWGVAMLIITSVIAAILKLVIL